ncbi:hypothetical protein NDU88_011506 [Pleurodeles waltl]|uniref:Uncharacterized protein n=1 Tax=Pleurodeles waltl TaxID=8319 RepID=A0AAV7QYY5_PLEWA|nr:hypothetical protein NDU88_011506 [Pleurodeles waltl]
MSEEERDCGVAAVRAAAVRQHSAPGSGLQAQQHSDTGLGLLNELPNEFGIAARTVSTSTAGSMGVPMSAGRVRTKQQQRARQQTRQRAPQRCSRIYRPDCGECSRYQEPGEKPGENQECQEN